MTHPSSRHPYRPSSSAAIARNTLLGNRDDLAREPGLLPEALRLLSVPNPSAQDLRSAARLLHAASEAAAAWANSGALMTADFRTRALGASA